MPVGDGFPGAALNVAARLCATAQPGETIATQTVRHLAADPEHRVRRLAPMRAEGPERGCDAGQGHLAGGDALAAVEPSSRDATKPATMRPALPAELEPIVPLAGRKTELRWLRWHWRRAGHGDGRCVVLSGQPGIGKTRLASELATFAYAAGARVSYVASSANPGRRRRGPASVERPAVIVDDLDAAGPELTAGSAGSATP